jgi:hypothetical protein
MQKSLHNPFLSSAVSFAGGLVSLLVALAIYMAINKMGATEGPSMGQRSVVGLDRRCGGRSLCAGRRAYGREGGHGDVRVPLGYCVHSGVARYRPLRPGGDAPACGWPWAAHWGGADGAGDDLDWEVLAGRRLACEFAAPTEDDPAFHAFIDISAISPDIPCKSTTACNKSRRKPVA